AGRAIFWLLSSRLLGRAALPGRPDHSGFVGLIRIIDHAQIVKGTGYQIGSLKESQVLTIGRDSDLIHVILLRTFPDLTSFAKEAFAGGILGIGRRGLPLDVRSEAQLAEVIMRRIGEIAVFDPRGRRIVVIVLAEIIEGRRRI